MVLDASLLNTQHYKVRIKGKVEQCREGVAPSPTPWCSSYRKGSLRVTLDYGRQLYLLIYIYIYILREREREGIERKLFYHIETENNIIVEIQTLYIYIYIYIWKGVVPSPIPQTILRCSSYWKKNLRFAYDYGRPTYFKRLMDIMVRVLAGPGDRGSILRWVKPRT